MIRNLDASAQVAGYRKMGSRSPGAPRASSVRDALRWRAEVLETERIVVATGSEQNAPPIESLQKAGHWANREATTTAEVPESRSSSAADRWGSSSGSSSPGSAPT